MIYLAVGIYIVGVLYGLLAFYWAGVVWNGPRWVPTWKQLAMGCWLALIWPLTALYAVLDEFLGK